MLGGMLGAHLGFALAAIFAIAAAISDQCQLQYALMDELVLRIRARLPDSPHKTWKDEAIIARLQHTVDSQCPARRRKRQLLQKPEPYTPVGLDLRGGGGVNFGNEAFLEPLEDGLRFASDATELTGTFVLDGYACVSYHAPQIGVHLHCLLFYVWGF